MEALALTPADLARALEVLGPDLESWRIAIREGFKHTPRDDEPYDPLVDGPLLKGGIVFVGRRHLDRVLLGLCAIEHQAHGMQYVRVVAALDGLKMAINRLEDGA